MKFWNDVYRPLQLAALAASSTGLVLAGCGGSAADSATAKQAVLAPAVASAVPATPAAALPAPAAPQALPAATTYSVINLGPVATRALLNDAHQAAFSYSSPAGLESAFFNGQQTLVLRSLGGQSTEVAGLNSKGEVVGTSTIALPPDDPGLTDPRRAFRWSAQHGMRQLPGPLPGKNPTSQALGINQGGQVAGYNEVEGVFGPLFAIRWSAQNGYAELGRLPGYGGAVAAALNEAGLAAGHADHPDGGARAMLWDAAGNATDLGKLAGLDAYGTHINAAGQVAGYAMTDPETFLYQGFVWERGSGMVAIGSLGGGASSIAQMNAKGQVVGQSDRADGWPHAIRWTRSGGMLDLHGGPYRASGALDVNAAGDVVGWIGEPLGDPNGGNGYVSRAVRWPGGAPPVDLNARLHQPPAGLVLTEALAVSSSGTILANSNAGLVMLRPGATGSDAPLLGPIEISHGIVFGHGGRLNLNFRDRNSAEKHTATVDWGDPGCAATAPTVSEQGGVGKVSAAHRYCAPGLYTITVKVSDAAGKASTVRREVQVHDPVVPLLSGRGEMLSARGGRAGEPLRRAVQPLRFQFQVRMAPPPAAMPGVRAAQAAESAGVLRLDGAVNFQSDRLALASLTTGTVRMSGTGRLNGRPGYRFVAEATDGDLVQPAMRDRLRVRISHADPRTGAEVIDYDNGAASAAARGGAQPLAMVGGTVPFSDRVTAVHGTIALRR
jgi:probable HAF family extracellular repeat protein